MVRREVGTKMCIEIECGDHPAARALAFLWSQSNWELPIRGTEKEEFVDDDQALAVRECPNPGIAARDTATWGERGGTSYRRRGTISYALPSC